MDVLGASLVDSESIRDGRVGRIFDGFRIYLGLGLNTSVFCTNICAVCEPLRCLVFGLCFGARELFFTLPIDASVNLKSAMHNYVQSSVRTGLANFERSEMSQRDHYVPFQKCNGLNRNIHLLKTICSLK